MRHVRFARALVAGLVAAVGLGASLALGFWRDARPLDDRAAELGLVVAAGAFIAALLSLILADLFARNASRPKRAVLTAFLALFFGIPGLAGLYGLHFAFHAYGELEFGDAFGWMHFAYVAIQGVAYFAIFGFRLIAPWAMLAVAAVALIAAPRPNSIA